MRTFTYKFLIIIFTAVLAVSTWAQDATLQPLFQSPLQNREAIQQHVTEAEASYKKRTTIEPLLLSALNSSALSSDAKKFIGEQLNRICDEDTVPALIKLLYKTSTGDIARRALEIIEHPDAQNALMQSLGKVRGSTLTGVIESLGKRRNPEALEPLRGFVKSGNTDIVKAALTALGEIGGSDAAEILGISRLNVRRSLRKDATAAYMRCAWNSLKDGDRETALTVFDTLLIEVEPIEIRQEALRGYIRTEQEFSIPLIIDTLRSDEASLQRIAAEEASNIPYVEATKALVDTFADLTPPIQLLVVRILGDRAEVEGLPTVIQSANNREPSVRLEALTALGKFNHPDTLQVLLKAVATGSEQEKKIAQATLLQLKGDKINEALVKSAMSADNAIRLEAVKIIPLKNATNATPVLARIATRDVKEIQFEALKALSVVGNQEVLQLMVDAWSSNTWSPSQREIIGEGIIAIAKRSPAGSDRVEALHAALKKSTSAKVQSSIIQALAQIQEDSSINILQSTMRKAPTTVQSEIIQILLNWPSPEILPVLEKLARTLDEVTLRDQAFQGYIKLLGETADHTTSTTAKQYQRALKLANTTQKRRQLLPGVSRLTDSLAKRIWDTLAKDPALKDEVEKLRH